MKAMMRRSALLGGLVILVLGFAPSSQSDAQNCLRAPSGLVGWWDGDRVSGTTAVDVSPYGNNAIMSGNVQTVPGVIGNAFSFDGTPGTRLSGTFGRGFSGGDLPITLAAWVNQPAPPVGHPGQGVLGVGNGNFKAHFFQRLSTGVGALDTSYVCLDGVVGPNRLCIGADDGADRWWPSNAAITNDAWHLVVSTYDPATREVAIYVDGQLDHSVTVAGGLSLGTEFWIGGDWYEDNFFVGLIDEVQVYNRSINATEVNAMFRIGPSGVCKRVTICHEPRTSAQQTLAVPAQSVAGHVDHGDTLGPCR